MDAVGRAAERLELADGRTLAWRITGPPDAPVVLFLHGSTGSRRTAPANPAVQVLAYDRPGYGGSSPHPERTLVSDAEDVRALLDHLGVAEVAVLGFSGGAATGYACAAEPSQRVRCLGVVSGAPWPTAPPPSAAALQAAAAALAADPAAAVARLSENAPPVDAAVLSLTSVTQRLLAGAQDSVGQGVQGWVEEARLVRSPWPFGPEAVRCPVLLWHGQDDTAVSLREARAVAEQLPDSRWQQVIPDAGHLGWLGQEAQILVTVGAGHPYLPPRVVEPADLLPLPGRTDGRRGTACA